MVKNTLFAAWPGGCHTIEQQNSCRICSKEPAAPVKDDVVIVAILGMGGEILDGFGTLLWEQLDGNVTPV